MHAPTPPSLSATRVAQVPASARRALLVGCAITAGCLMLALVQVCHEAVARGERWRAEQRALFSPVLLASQRTGRP